MLISILMAAAQAAHVQYCEGEIGENEQFYTIDGWGREPLTAHLEIPGEIIGEVFPHPEAELSLTAKIEGVAIAQRNCNRWDGFLVKFEENLKKLKASDVPENISLFIGVLEKALSAELSLKALFKSKSIELNEIAHNAGLVVLAQYQSLGIANKLQELSIKMLKNKGFKAIVCETTNKRSARVMNKQGFIKFAKFAYEKDCEIKGLSDSYTIWYRLL